MYAKEIQNNSSFCLLFGQRSIKPEYLPSAEDIKKMEPRVAKEEKSMQKDTSKQLKK